MAKFVRLSLAAIAALASLALANPSIADDFEASLVACLSNGTAIGGVGSCGKIWKIKSGKAELKKGGKLEVEAKGLVLNDPTTEKYNNTPDGVDAVAAAVICQGPAGPAVAAQTEAMPLSKEGNVKIKATVSLPNGCAGPIIVLRERYEGKIGGWLAGTGL